MYSASDICNLALSALGVPKIISLEQDSPEAEACSLVYELARDMALTEFDWGFATKQARLNELNEEPLTIWQHVYEAPNDVLRVQTVHALDSPNREGVPFEVGYQRRIYTNAGDAVALVTESINDNGVFPPHFVDVFSMRLAMVLTGTLQNVANRVQHVTTLYTAALRRGMVAEASQSHALPPKIPLIDVRGAYDSEEYNR